MGFTQRKFLIAGLASFLGLSIWGCGSHQAKDVSDVKVTNGRSATMGEFPSVVLIVMLTPQGQGICTGTFINDSQMMTAAHCMEGMDPRRPAVFYVEQVDGKAAPVAQALSFSRHPDYNIALGVSAVDVSVINFPAATAPAITGIAPAAPAKGAPLTIVGFGNNENFVTRAGEQGGSGAGSKRVGTNKVAAVEQGFISFFGVPGRVSELPEGDLVSSGSGDSGGPLFVDNKLAGVTSGGGLRMTSAGLLSASLYVDLNGAQVKDFLSQAVKPQSLPR